MRTSAIAILAAALAVSCQDNTPGEQSDFSTESGSPPADAAVLVASCWKTEVEDDGYIQLIRSSNLSIHYNAATETVSFHGFKGEDAHESGHTRIDGDIVVVGKSATTVYGPTLWFDQPTITMTHWGEGEFAKKLVVDQIKLDPEFSEVVLTILDFENQSKDRYTYEGCMIDNSVIFGTGE